ncbi:MAG: GAF domain-containing protein [Chitinophagaceae bacterium]|nr:MAG: GAF domain-containing protein [Chitinophagaceae bacterium]
MLNTFGIPIIPQNDEDRLAALKRYKILDTPPEGSFNNIAKLATQIFDVPISLISLVGAEEVFFKANVGMGNTSKTSRGVSLCSLAVLSEELTVFEDAPQEPCLLANPLVAGDFGLKFYAGAPLVTMDGFLIGTMCIVDKKTRTFSEKDRGILKGLAAIVMDEIELRLASITENDLQQQLQEELQAMNEELTTSNEELDQHQKDIEAILVLLKESESKAKSMVMEAPIPIGLLTGPELIVESANHRILELWGKSAAIIGQPLHIALPELQGQPFLGLLQNTYHNGEPFYGKEARASLVHDHIKKDLYFNFVYFPLKNDQGKVYGILVIASDVTEQVLSREAIQRAEEMLRLATDAAQLGTWSLQLDNMEFTASVRLRELFGYAAGYEMKFEDIAPAISGEHRDKMINTYERVIHNKEHFEVEFPVKDHNTGEVRWLRAAGLYNNIGGLSPRFSGTVWDITERKLDDNRKNDFIAMVSHELKTPLTTLKGYIQLMELGTGDNEFLVEALSKAGKQAHKMETLIKGFLDISKLDSGKILLQPSLFKIKEIIDDAVEDVGSTMQRSQINSSTCEDIEILGDKNKLSQVVTNLLSNAIKYSPVNSPIEITCSKKEGQIIVGIRDQGLGIKKEDQDKLFERFSRIENSAHDNIAGFGIGLYLCKEIISRHHGRLWVETEYGKGSVFYFSIPAA